MIVLVVDSIIKREHALPTPLVLLILEKRSPATRPEKTTLFLQLERAILDVTSCYTSDKFKKSDAEKGTEPKVPGLGDDILRILLPEFPTISPRRPFSSYPVPDPLILLLPIPPKPFSITPVPEKKKERQK
jgi:hypothetical protein